MAAPQSLVLITVDCLRADHVGFLGYRRPTTPFLDSLSAESLVFRNAIAAGAPTYYSFPSIMASRHALALGRDVIGLAPEEPTIATALQESGYATAAFVAANPYLSPRFGYDSGFDTFRDFMSSEVDLDAGGDSPNDQTGSRRPQSGINRSLAALCHRLGPLGSIYDELYFQYCQRVGADTAPSLDALRRFPSADVIVDQAREWLASITGRPFFLWLHFMDPHAPYYPPEKAHDLLGQPILGARRARYLNSYWNRGGLTGSRFQTHRDEMLALYDAGIRWVDEHVARLAATLGESGLWDKSLLAVTADHGEEFLDHGGRYHSPPSVQEEIVHVPLMLRVPRLDHRASVQSPFSLLDLAPTLLDALEAQVPGSFSGHSRWAQLRAGGSWEDPAVSECVVDCRNPFHLENRLGRRSLAIHESHYKLEFDFGSSIESLFDLELDPGALRPLPRAAEMPVRRRLLEQARRHLVESLQSRDADARLAARLRDFRLELPTSTLGIST